MKQGHSIFRNLVAAIFSEFNVGVFRGFENMGLGRDSVRTRKKSTMSSDPIVV